MSLHFSVITAFESCHDKYRHSTVNIQP